MQGESASSGRPGEPLQEQLLPGDAESAPASSGSSGAGPIGRFIKSSSAMRHAFNRLHAGEHRSGDASRVRVVVRACVVLSSAAVLLVVLLVGRPLTSVQEPVYDMRMEHYAPDELSQMWNQLPLYVVTSTAAYKCRPDALECDPDVHFTGITNTKHKHLCMSYSSTALDCYVGKGSAHDCAETLYEDDFVTPSGQPKVVLSPCPIPYIFFNGTCGFNGLCFDVRFNANNTRLVVGSTKVGEQHCVHFRDHDAVVVPCAHHNASAVTLSVYYERIVPLHCPDGACSSTVTRLNSSDLVLVPLEGHEVHHGTYELALTSIAFSGLSVLSIVILLTLYSFYTKQVELEGRTSVQLLTLNTIVVVALAALGAQLLQVMATRNADEDDASFRVLTESIGETTASIAQLCLQIIEVIVLGGWGRGGGVRARTPTRSHARTHARTCSDIFQHHSVPRPHGDSERVHRAAAAHHDHIQHVPLGHLHHRQARNVGRRLPYLLPAGVRPASGVDGGHGRAATVHRVPHLVHRVRVQRDLGQLLQATGGRQGETGRGGRAGRLLRY